MPSLITNHCAQSPNELQDLLDATRLLLDELEAKQRAAADAVNAGAVPSPEPDSDELREKFRIMKVAGHVVLVRVAYPEFLFRYHPTNAWDPNCIELQ